MEILLFTRIDPARLHIQVSQEYLKRSDEIECSFLGARWLTYDHAGTNTLQARFESCCAVRHEPMTACKRQTGFECLGVTDTVIQNTVWHQGRPSREATMGGPKLIRA